MIIYCDTRERTPPPFPDGVALERVTMSEADYTTQSLQGIAVIERKSVCDFASSLSWQRDRFEDEMRRLREYRWKCVIVEGDITEVYRWSAMHPHAVLGSCASLFARHDCPVLFAGNPVGCGRMIAGLLKRFEERLGKEAAREI